jgi:cation diffusion facilitator CzcD-associated flavoprotein CzcO
MGFYTDSFLSKLFASKSKSFINKSIKNEVKRELMAPKHRFGCTRVTFSDSYYHAIDSSKTYIHDGNIEKVEGKTLYLKDGSKVTVDVLILATGYKTGSPYKELDIVNTNNGHIDINYDKIGSNPQINYGITISGVPNFFMMLGPTSAAGHSSAIYMTECQANYIIKTLRKMMKYNISSVDLKPEVGDAYWQWVQHKAKPMAWYSNCKTWYLNSKGEVILK